MATFISQRKVTYDYPTDLIYPKKLDTAMRDTFDYTFNTRISKHEQSALDQLILSSHLCSGNPSDLRRDSLHCAYIIEYLLLCNPSDAVNKESRQRYTRMEEAACTIISAQVEYLFSKDKRSRRGSIIRKFRDKMSRMRIPEEIRILLDVAHWLSAVIDSGAASRQKQGRRLFSEYLAALRKSCEHSHPSLPLHVINTHEYVVIKLNQDTWLAPHAALLQLHNKICDVISVLVFASSSAGASNPEDAYELTIHALLILSDIARSHPDHFYSIMKCLEPLGTAETIALEERWTNTEFLDNVVDDLYKDTGFLYTGSPLQTLLRSVDSAFRHELMCLTKCLGHPYVSMEGGAVSLFRTTNEAYVMNMEKIRLCTDYIKLGFIRKHVADRHRWPSVTLDKDAPLAVFKCLMKNLDPMSSKCRRICGEIKPEHMRYVHLNPIKRYNKLENIIPYLKDKTISIARKEVVAKYLEEGHHDEGRYDATRDWQKTRLLLAYLLCPTFEHDYIQYIDDYNDADTLDHLLDYLVIRIVPKEKEMKVDFRGFGAKTYEDRFRALAQEHNCMRYLDDFCDEQAMTLSELQIAHKLNSFRNLWRAYRGYDVLYIVIDAKKWNNHFRAESVHYPMQETLDRIFGTRTFAKTHMAFQNSLIYVPGCPTTYYWDGQSGGIEGLNQDTWVVVYLGMIHTALHDLGMKTHLLAKGDDLRVAVLVPPSLSKVQSIAEIKKNIVLRISTTMKDFGHAIKVEESYGSSRYFAFSKNASIDNIELPQTYRKIQKCYGASNAMIATLDEYIASTFSNAHSACKVSTAVLPCYYVAIFWSLHYLMGHHLYQELTNAEYAALLLVPSMLGGFPIIYLHNMSVRAESDLLSPFLGFCLYTRRAYPELYDVMQKFLSCRVSCDYRDIKQLMKDPYAVPLDRPPLPTAILKQSVAPILKEKSKNEDLLELIDAAEQDEEDMLRLLHSANEYNVKVMCTLYAATPRSILDEVLCKFEKARSINELALRCLGSFRTRRLLRKVIRAERALQQWRHSRVRDRARDENEPMSRFLLECPAQSAAELRKHVWRKEVTGITMPPLQHQVYLVDPSDPRNDQWVDENHFAFYIQPSCDKEIMKPRDHYKTGNVLPFLGFTTTTGTARPESRMLEKDPLMDKVQHLVDVCEWTDVTSIDADTGDIVSSNVRTLVTKLLRSFTTCKLEDFTPFVNPRKSGTIQHHLRAPSYRESIVPNTLSNWYTRVRGEVDSHVRLRSSREHFTVNFLHIYCHVVWLLAWDLEVSEAAAPVGETWCVTTDCRYCNIPIIEQPLVFDDKKMARVYAPVLRLTRLGGVSHDMLRESLTMSHQRRDLPSATEETLTFEDACIGIVQEYIDITSTKHDSTASYYGCPTLSEEGEAVLSKMGGVRGGKSIGQSEIKRIPTSILAENVCVAIFESCLDRSTRGGSASTIRKVMDAPVTDTPWYNLIKFLAKTGRMVAIIEHICKILHLPKPAGLHEVGSCVRFFTAYHDKFLTKIHADTPVVILANYEARNIVQHLMTVFRYHLDRLYHGKFKSFLDRDAPPGGWNDDLATLWDQFLVFCLIADNCALTAEETSNRIKSETGTVVCEIQAFGSADIDPYEAAAVISSRRFQTPTGSYYFRQLKGRLEAYPDIDPNWTEDRYITTIDSLCHILDTVNTRLVYTTLAACVNKVRSTKTMDVDTTSTDASDPSVDAEDQTEWTIESANRSDTWHIPSRDYHPAPATAEFKDDAVDFDFTYVDLSSLYRVIGSENGSETTAIALMHRFSIVPERCNIRGAYCLADGQGGFIGGICHTYPNASFVYHTHVGGESQFWTTPQPRFAIQHFNLDEINVYVEHLAHGYTDFRNPLTITKIFACSVLCDIVSVDIELASSVTTTDRRSIYRNILDGIIRRRHQSTVMIIKVDVRYVSTFAMIISVISHHFRSVYLDKPTCVKHAGYAYIVAQGIRRNYDSAVCQQAFEIAPSTHALVTAEQLVRNITRGLGTHYNAYMTGINLTLLRWDHLFPRSITPDNCHARVISLLVNLLHHREFADLVTSVNNSWEHVRRAARNAASWQGLSTVLHLHLQDIIEDRLRGIRALPHGVDSRMAHVEAVTSQWWRYVGMFAVVRQFTGPGRPWKYKMSQTELDFRCYATALPVFAQLGILDPTRTYRDPAHTYYEVTVRYAPNYRLGLDVGLSCVWFLLA